MKKSLLRSFATRWAGGAAAVLLTVGVLGSSQALAGITGTKHDLSATGSLNKFAPASGGNGEICVFCHTPHGADATAAVPLWNRKLGSQGAAYVTYNSLGTSSLDGATAAVGSVSLACLSCHDGTQAMNTLINQPGSGGYNSAGADWSGTWTGSNKPAGVALLGTDLQDDHPIGIQYAGGPSGAITPTVGVPYAFKDLDFKATTSATINSQPVWWVDTEASPNGTRQKTDMQLYTRGVGNTYVGGTSTIAATTPQPFVECASCHDPHTSANVTFLRIANTGSAVCLACHTK